MAALPMMVYLPLYVYNNRFVQDYYYAAERFRYSLIIVGIILIFSLAVNAQGWQQGLPFLFLYVSLSITLLRLLRHDDQMARSRRFRILNLAEVVLVCAAGFAASQPEVLGILRGHGCGLRACAAEPGGAERPTRLQLVLYASAWVMSKLFPAWARGSGRCPS